ncbi:MAG: hypothetical protein KDA24_24535 [Deltaproteobacteria bacterium]|nr:hypothetical protein [Deltaproteobacteria bacterium]
MNSRCTPAPRRAGLILTGLALLMLAIPATASASHFRYGQIAWERSNPTTRTVTVEVTTAWRSDFIDNVVLRWGDGASSNMPVSAYTNLGTFTDSAGTSYSVMRQSRSHTYGSDGPFTAWFSSCCRIGGLVNAANAGFRVQSVIDLSGGNTGGPVSAIPVLAQMVQGGLNVMPLPIAEPDGDAVTCRLATDSEAGWGSRQQPGEGTANPMTVAGCVLTWDTSLTSVGQRYAYQVVIEEAGGGSTALDAMIEIVDGTLNAPPVCAGGGSFTIAPGNTFTSQFIGTDDDGDNLTANMIGIPGGASFGPTSGTSPLTSTFQWTPTVADIGAYAATIQFQDPGNLTATCALGMTVTCVDSDNDGVCDEDDNCVDDANPDQEDGDLDGAGDACDVCPADPTDDGSDGDGVCDDVDNCVGVPNPDQANADGDLLGDACDTCPLDADNDIDGDGVCGNDDNCPDDANPAQDNFDGDDLGDVCDPDDDNDGVDDGDDVCAESTGEAAPTRNLGTNRWADTDNDGDFDTVTRGNGNGSGRSFTNADTGGCTCSEIIDICGYGNGHTFFGCSNSVMDWWTGLYDRAGEAAYQCKSE